MRGFVIVIGILILGNDLRGEAYRLESGSESPRLVELYTSEGCSSCPPAEKWISRFLDDPNLWTKVVPVAFHVDYWDRLGWKDPFATRENTLRQYRLRDEGAIRSIYTPGFVVDGREWRGWFQGERLDFQNSLSAKGKLAVEIDAGEVNATYSNSSDDLLLNVVILGIGLESKVTRGENRGRTLAHSFVALAHQEHPLKRGRVSLALPVVPFDAAMKWGIAFWVVSRSATEPEVVVGSWVPEKALIPQRGRSN